MTCSPRSGLSGYGTQHSSSLNTPFISGVWHDHTFHIFNDVSAASRHHGFWHTTQHFPGFGCRKSHRDGLSPLAQRESLTFSDLKKYYLAFPNHTLEPMNQSDSALTAIDQFLPDLVRTITDKHIVEVGTVNSVVELVRQHTDTYAIAFAPAHYRYSGVQTGELVCVPLREKGVEAELQLLYPVLAFQQHPSFRSLVNNLESEMQRFVQVHLPA